MPRRQTLGATYTPAYEIGRKKWLPELLITTHEGPYRFVIRGSQQVSSSTSHIVGSVIEPQHPQGRPFDILYQPALHRDTALWKIIYYVFTSGKPY